jgi:hypothetical protein
MVGSNNRSLEGKKRTNVGCRRREKERKGLVQATKGAQGEGEKD